jgi:hypothetical protein
MTISARFRGRCSACGLYFDAGTPVEWSRGKGARHATPAGCAAARAAAVPPPTAVSGSHKPIADFLTAARLRGLRFPKARFLAPDGRAEVLLYLAGLKSTAPGSVQVKVGGEWVGRVEPDGTVIGGRLVRDAAMLALLEAIAQDPVDAARRYGALTARCSFCAKPLTDEGSVNAGYGPVCARKWGLPHTALGTLEVEPVPVATCGSCGSTNLGAFVCGDCGASNLRAVAAMRVTLGGDCDGTLDAAEGKDYAAEEASSLGLAPGEWPQRFTHPHGLVFHRRSLTERDGDVLYADYETEDGIKLCVLND